MKLAAIIILVISGAMTVISFVTPTFGRITKKDKVIEWVCLILFAASITYLMYSTITERINKH